MNNQHFRRKQQWRVARNMRKRRVNLYFLEQRVQKLEQHQEINLLDSENTADLLKALEIKVNMLVDENKRLKAQGKKPKSLMQKMWQLIYAALAQKGNP